MNKDHRVARCLLVALLSVVITSCSDAHGSLQQALIAIGLADEHLDPVQLEWLVDTTVGSPGADASILESHVPVVIEYLAHRPKGVLHLWRLGASAATTEIVFTLEAPGPEKPSKSSRDAYRAAFVQEGKAKLHDAIKELLHQPPPRLSPLFDAATVVGRNTVRQDYKKLVLITSDLRDVTPSAGRFFECGPLPDDAEAFARGIHEQALLVPDSLKGVGIIFTYANNRPVHGNGCEQPAARWAQLEGLWKTVMTTTGARTSFYTRGITFDDLSGFTLSWIFVPLFGPGLFARRTYWSLWVWLTAWRDAAKRIYAPKDALFRRLQYYPRYDVTRNATDRDMEAVFLNAMYRIEQIVQRIEKLQHRLAEQYPFWVVVIGIMVLVLFEVVGVIVLVKDAGITGPERVITGILVALGAIFLTWVVWVIANRRLEAEKKKDKDGIRRATIQFGLAMAVYTIVVIAIVLVRLFALIGSTGVGVGDLAMAIVMGLSVIGAPWMTKLLLESLVTMLPDQRRLWQARKELRQVTVERDRARRYQHRREAQRLFWLQEGSRLLALYNIKHRHACKTDKDKWGNGIVYVSDPDKVATDNEKDDLTPLPRVQPEQERR